MSVDDQNESARKEEVMISQTSSSDLYEYPLPPGITIGAFQLIDGDDKKAIDEVLRPKPRIDEVGGATSKEGGEGKKENNTQESVSNDKNANDEEKKKEREKQPPPPPPPPPSSFINRETLENLFVELEVDNGPKIENVTTVCLAALVGNVDYLKAVAAASPFLRELAFATTPKSKPPSCRRTLTEFACRGSSGANTKQVLQFLRDESLLHFDKANDNGTYPLVVAAQEGNLAALQFLHQDCGMPLTYKHASDGLNAFHVAVRFGRLDVVAYFLEQAKQSIEVEQLIDAPLTVRSTSGVVLGMESAFTIACSVRNQSVELVRILYEAGLHKSALNEALEHARPMKVLRVEEHVANAASKRDPAKTFRKYKHFPVLPDSAVVKESSNNNIKTNSGILNIVNSASSARPLGPALGHYQLSVGGDRSECNAPLHAAVKANNVEVVKFLCETVGFDIDKDAIVGLRAPLHIAVRNGLNAIAEYLITQLRCNVNKKAKDGSFALYIAAYNKNDELVELLMRCGANSSLTWHEVTPFFAAIAQSNVSTVKLLLESKADVSPQFQERGPAQYARDRGLVEVAKFLEENRIY